MMQTWIDAAEFNNYGGFSLETQFTQEMGQAYLLAYGKPGVSVDAASTEFEIETEGYYRIWIRTKNWLRGYAPGRLKAIVDDERFSEEIGTQPNGQWYWEVAGDIKLLPGVHSLKILDSTGYFGRFSSVVITNDFNYVPEHDINRMHKERLLIRNESTKVVEVGNFDFVVAGAGAAGICAAVAAARKGAKVALVQSRPGLGGNSSDEGTIGLDGAASHHFGMRESGIVEEIRRIHDHKEISWEAAFCEVLNAEKNISVFYNKFIIDAKTVNNQIEAIYALDAIDVKVYEFEGKIFADCTGDGWVGYFSGAKYRLGREAKHEFGESLAPVAPDNYTMSGSLLGTYDHKQMLGYYAVETNHAVPFQAPNWAVKLPEGNELHRKPNRLYTGEWWLENSTDWDDLWDQETVRDEMIRLNLGYFHWLKNSYEKKELARNLDLVALGKYNGRRENRRLIGDYILTENDCVNGTKFEDGISYCGWTIDVHHPKGIYSGVEGPYFSDVQVQLCAVPFRTLYSKNIQNLLFAGRCISVSHLALGSVRVQSTLATLGQVVGLAAMNCLNKKISPREIYQNHMKEFQQELLSEDLFIPGVKSNFEKDYAKKAEISASSYKQEPFQTERGVLDGWRELNGIMAMSRPVSKQISCVKPLLKNVANHEVKTKAYLIGLTSSGDFENLKIIQKKEITIPANFEDYYAIDFGINYSNLKEKNIGLMLDQQKLLFWREINLCSDGRRRGYPIAGTGFWQTDNANSLEVNFWNQKNEMANCSPSQIVNGYNRILSKEEYAWVSDPDKELPQWLLFSWAKEIPIQHILIIFDTDMGNPSFSYLTQPIVENTVKDFEIQLFDKLLGKYKTIKTIKGNYLRKFDFYPDEVLVTDRLVIKIDETWGSKSARIIEVKIF